MKEFAKAEYQNSLDICQRKINDEAVKGADFYWWQGRTNGLDEGGQMEPDQLDSALVHCQHMTTTENDNLPNAYWRGKLSGLKAVKMWREK